MKKDTKPVEAAATPAVILFGLDDSQRPHASWFAEPDAMLAEKAAGLMGMQVLRVTIPEHRAVALALAVGRVFASGKLVPFVAKGAYDRLTAFEGAFKPEPATAPAEPMPDVANTPATWADIGGLSLDANATQHKSLFQRHRPKAALHPSSRAMRRADVRSYGARVGEEKQGPTRKQI